MESLTSIYSAIKTNDIEEMKTAIKTLPQDINKYFNTYNVPPLSLAILQGCSIELIKELINADANINEGMDAEFLRNVDTNALVLACKNKNLKVLELLIESGGVVDVKDFNGLPLLHLACMNEVEFVKLLIFKGADQNIVCPKKNSALHWAVSHKSSFETIHFLLKCGLNPSAKNSNGVTSVEMGLCNGVNFAIITMLKSAMHQKKRSCGIASGVKRKLDSQGTSLDKLRADVQKEEKKLKTLEQGLSTTCKKYVSQKEKRLPLAKTCIEARKKVAQYFDTENTLFGAYLDCPICLNDFLPEKKIFQCSNGHLFCLECHEKFSLCPQCSIQMNKSSAIRNRVLESIIEGMRNS